MDIEELVPQLMAVRRGEGFLLPVLLPALQIRLMREQGGVPGAVIQDALPAVILMKAEILLGKRRPGGVRRAAIQDALPAVILMKAEILPGKR